jgi:hypothetical protein
LLHVLEVAGDDSVGFLEADKEFTPGGIKVLYLFDFFLSEAFNLTTIAFAFPAFNVLKLLLDGAFTGFPLILLSSDFCETSLMLLKHFKTGAILLKLLNSVLEQLQEEV